MDRWGWDEWPLKSTRRVPCDSYGYHIVVWSEGYGTKRMSSWREGRNRSLVWEGMFREKGGGF